MLFLFTFNGCPELSIDISASYVDNAMEIMEISTSGHYSLEFRCRLDLLVWLLNAVFDVEQQG